MKEYRQTLKLSYTIQQIVKSFAAILAFLSLERIEVAVKNSKQFGSCFLPFS